MTEGLISKKEVFKSNLLRELETKPLGVAYTEFRTDKRNRSSRLREMIRGYLKTKTEQSRSLGNKLQILE